jgi:hypothetical protein
MIEWLMVMTIPDSLTEKSSPFTNDEEKTEK